MSNVTYWPCHRQAGTPVDKYPVNTSHGSRFVCTSFTAVLFGSNGNSYTVSVRQIRVYIHILFVTQRRRSGKRNTKTGTAATAE